MVVDSCKRGKFAVKGRIIRVNNGVCCLILFFAFISDNDKIYRSITDPADVNLISPVGKPRSAAVLYFRAPPYRKHEVHTSFKIFLFISDYTYFRACRLARRHGTGRQYMPISTYYQRFFSLPRYFPHTRFTFTNHSAHDHIEAFILSYDEIKTYLSWHVLSGSC